MTREELEQLALQLKQVTGALDGEQLPALQQARAQTIRRTIVEATERLRRVAETLDPIKRPGAMFDPANPSVVGRMVGITMVAQPRLPLADVGRFYGSGVYAIYYKGDFEPYQAISGREHPLYVGKADPADASGKTPYEQGERLARRLNEHRKNIEKATSTLRPQDFEFRALVVQTGWQGSAESYLIHLFKPVWNSEINICYGFGKHGDAAETRSNLRSPWDTLHPGRAWAGSLYIDDAKPRAQIVSEITAHLAQNPPLESVELILARFLEEIRVP